MPYQVDLPSLEFHFPEGVKVPPLLIKWAEWLAEQPDAGVGWFEIQGWRLDDYGFEYGHDLESQFALFLHTPGGGRVGYWLHDGCPIEEVPIVHIGSEGQLETIAPSLLEFIERILGEPTQIYDIDPKDFTPEVAEQLKAWCAEQERPKTSQRTFPPFADWLTAWTERQTRLNASIPELAELARLLRKHVPGEESWRCAGFRIICVGEMFTVEGRVERPLPPNEVQEMEPLVRALRLARVQRRPEMGLWLVARLDVYPQGVASIYADYLERPPAPGRTTLFVTKFVDLPPDQLLADLEQFPRSPRWTPAWFNKAPNRPSKATHTVEYWIAQGFCEELARVLASANTTVDGD